MEGRGFPRAGRAALRYFPRAKPKGNPEEPPCQPEENSVLPDSFTQIYILFLIGFRIGPPKTHRRFRIALPKIHRRFRIGPPNIHRRFYIGPAQVTLNLLLPESHSLWILVYHGYHVRKATQLPIWNRMQDMICCPSAVKKCLFKRAYYSILGKECFVFGNIIFFPFRM